MLKNLFLVFIGGGLGSILRYVVHYVISKKTITDFPVSTLLVNILGSFLIGFIYALSAKSAISDDTRLFMAIGICGGFTTFSSFSFDSIQLLRNGQVFMFGGYVLLSISLCIVFVLLGDLIGKSFISTNT